MPRSGSFPSVRNLGILAARLMVLPAAGALALGACGNPTPSPALASYRTVQGTRTADCLAQAHRAPGWVCTRWRITDASTGDSWVRGNAQ